MRLTRAWIQPVAALRRWFSRATEPHILFPAIAILGLGAIWGTTVNLINVERTAAENTAAVTSREVAETYEAQVIRALREIDQTLKIVKYAYELKGKNFAMQELKARELLPPAQFFVISIADRAGNIVASTRPSELKNVADQEYFQSAGQTDELSIGRPRQNPGSGTWELRFSRRLTAAGATLSGVVTVAVAAAYFVGGYEASKLGAHGVLGILGTDGIFRARRSGETASAGDRVDYAAVVSARGEAAREAALATNPWDYVPRYTVARKLYGFPLAVIVGLSADEQLATARSDMRTYVWRASAVSLLLILVVALLGSLSLRLAATRQRVVEAQMAHAERVEYIAYHDELTTLPNRSLFSKLLDQNITLARRYKRQVAVLFIDLDGFKYVNDSLGHDAGDQLLREVAARLKACLRDSDTVARLGGDEFVALLPEVEADEFVSAVAQKILIAIARTFVLRNREFRVTGSIGISIYPRDGLDEQTLTKNADIAMYQAKAEGKNNYQYYTENLSTRSLERLSLESNLRNALERDEFQLFYQCKRESGSGRISGMEALLRWQNPALGTVAPMRFIPIAEELGFTVAIGKWVLRTACEQNAAWQKQGLPRMSMSVNLTARQFSDEKLLPDLKAILAETGMDAHLLELEITESVLMRDIERSLRILNALRKLGIRIAIDDFGIGYASLATLRQFPLDTIKIDRSLIRDFASVPENRNLAKAIIAMGKTLSLTVVAQGVETAEQADFLRDNACGEIQGFYFSKAVAPGEFAEMVEAQPAIATTAA